MDIIGWDQLPDGVQMLEGQVRPFLINSEAEKLSLFESKSSFRRANCDLELAVHLQE